jgi:hypothetical protein
MAEPKALTLKYLRDLAKKHLGPASAKLKTKAQLMGALKKLAPGVFDDRAPAKKAKPSAQTPVRSKAKTGAGSKPVKAASPATIIKFKAPLRSKGGKGKASPAPEPVQHAGEPLVEGFFVARVAGESEAQRRRLTEDHGRPLRQVRVVHGYDEGLGDLPGAYEDDALVLLARDPHTLFVYWDFHPETLKSAREGLKRPKPLIRLFDKGTLVREVDFALESKSFYLHRITPGRRYHVEIVFVGSDGQSKRIGRPSNSVEAPSDGVSGDTSVRFLKIPWGFPLGRLKELAEGTVSHAVPPLEQRYRVWKRVPLPGSAEFIESSEERVERTPGHEAEASARRITVPDNRFLGASDQVAKGGASEQRIRNVPQAGKER